MLLSCLITAQSTGFYRTGNLVNVCFYEKHGLPQHLFIVFAINQFELTFFIAKFHALVHA